MGAYVKRYVFSRCSSNHFKSFFFFFFFFFFFNKLSLRKKFIREVERLNVKQRRSRNDVCKSLLLSPVAMKELSIILFISCNFPMNY